MVLGGIDPRPSWLVPDDQVGIHERLVNWGAWSRDRGHRSHCKSLEHRYRSPVTEEDDHGVRRQGRMIDQPDALCVFDLVTGLEPRSRHLIHLWYVHRSPQGFICRKLKMSRDEFVVELHGARRRLIRLCKLRGMI